MRNHSVKHWASTLIALLVASLLAPAPSRAAGETTLRVDAGQVGRPVSRYLSGACIEDVNHEIYGGIYSQLIFGESFQEPPKTTPVKDFTATDGEWRAKDGELFGGEGNGPKLLTAAPLFGDGEAGVEVYLPGAGAGDAGLIVHVTRGAGAGADNFNGYEIAVDTARKMLVIGRHQHNFRLLKEAKCEIAPDRWISLTVKFTGRTIEAFVDGKSVASVEDENPLPLGTIGLRQWQRTARYRNLWLKNGLDGTREDLKFEPMAENSAASGAWTAFASDGVKWSASLEEDRPFVGRQSQRLTFESGPGEVGLANEGLNRRGIAFSAGKPYEGYVWLRSRTPVEVTACLEDRAGSHIQARSNIAVSGDEWKRYDFALTPTGSETNGRFTLRLTGPGSVAIGHAFLQPGEWGRFKSLPVRRDVAEGMVNAGFKVLRYGGSMVNAPAYRWKNMIGPRDRRPPYRGTWYPESTNGWGIIDFLNLCEAAGFLGIPDFNIDESPQDMADFVECVNGKPDSPWGQKRAADGHPEPYNLRQVELGNEEKVDETYLAKFEKLSAAIWAKDPGMILVVGDFQYERRIDDPMHITGADSRITSLAAHQKILDIARRAGGEVWFDVHVWTEAPATSSALALTSYIDAIDRLANGAKHRVVVFEFNANTHNQRRAMANASAITRLIADGRVPVALSANCLQPDGQNDNGWNQGLLFLNQTRTWLQPPGYVAQMLSRHYQPIAIDARVDNAPKGLTAAAERSEDGKRLVLYVVNEESTPAACQFQLDHFTPAKDLASVETLAAAPGDQNTAAETNRVQPARTDWRHDMKSGSCSYAFPPCSFTVIQFE